MNDLGNCYEVPLNERTGNELRFGSLYFLESERDIRFVFKRMYSICGVKKGIIRGQHAHKALSQLIVCLYGAIEIECDGGEKKATIVLDEPKKGLYIGPGIWRTMKWLKDESVLLVLASDYYNESDYIRNYDEFIQLVKGGYWKK